MPSKSHNLLTLHLKSLPEWQYKGIVYVLLLMIVINALRTSFGAGYHYHLSNCDETSRWVCAFGFTEMYLLPITIGLTISASGLWLRRAVGLILSFIGLLLVGLTYFDWRRATLSVMQDNGMKYFSQVSLQKQYVVALYNSTLWDVAVLLTTIALFFWQLKIIINVMKLKRRQAPLLRT